MKNEKSQQSLGFQFGMFMRSFRKLVVKKFHERDTGLTLEQFGVLHKINEDGEPTQTDLAHALGVDKSAIMRTIDILEEKRLVARMEDREDRRKKILVLTKQGADKVKEAERFFGDMIEEMSIGVKESEMTHFIKVLQQLTTNAESKLND